MIDLKVGRRRAVALLAVGALALTSACGNDDDGGTDGQGDYTVAIMANLTGAGAASFGGVAPAVQAAFDRANKGNGVNGHKIKYQVYDAQSTTAGMQAVLQQALATEPDLIQMGISTAQFDSVVPTLNAAKVPVFAVATDAKLLLPNPTPWLYTFNGIPTSYAPAANAAALQALNVTSLAGKKVAWVYVNSPGVVPIAALSIKLIEQAGGIVVADEKNPLTGMTSFASQAANIVAKNPDVILGLDLQGNVTTEVPALRTAGYTGPIIIVGEGANTDAIFAQLKDPKFYSSRQYSQPAPGDAATTAVTASNMADAVGKAFFPLGWQMGNAALVALGKCGNPCTTENLQKTVDGMSSITFDGDLAMTPMSFSATKHWAPTSINVFVWDSAAGKANPFGTPISVAEPPPSA